VAGPYEPLRELQRDGMIVSTNDLLVSGVIPTNERQLWLVGEHLVGTPLIANEHEPA